MVQHSTDQLDQTSTQSPSIITGGIVGGLLMLPVLALSYMGSRIAELPSVADDFFAFIRDLLPGDLITFGIDTMIAIIEFLDLGRVDDAAKQGEQAMAYLMVLGVGIVFGALLYVALRGQKRSNVLIISAGVGVILGVAMAFISENEMIIVNLLNPEEFTLADGLWVGGLFTIFGAGLGWVYTNLMQLPLPGQVETPAPDAEKPVGQPVSVQEAAGSSLAPVTASKIDRRQFLVRVGGATATLTVVGAGLGNLLQDDGSGGVAVASSNDQEEAIAEATPEATPEAGSTPAPESTAEATPEATPTEIADDLPNKDASLKPAAGTRPEYTPLDDHYRIDISTRPPRIGEQEWALLINGLVEERTVMTLADLRSYEAVDQFVTLSCISNRLAGDLISTTRWTGVPLVRLLDEWNVQPEANYMRITAADGFDEYVSLDLIRNDERIMLAYEWDGKPLKEKHGFPLRIYIPDHYGMKQPKWIIGIEMVADWDEGYWVRRGWSDTAIVRTVSVVDTVATDEVYEEDGQMFVPVGGIAYAGARGISKVEVSVDDGEWVETQLRDPLSELTWVIWRYDWPFEEGRHTFRVRTYDGTGAMQTLDTNGVRPNGATGIHSLAASV